jgi:hypothetical protein
MQPGKELAELEQIHDAVEQHVSGGESIFGVDGFTPLCRPGFGIDLNDAVAKAHA